jgi:uncharacterized protein (DUF983 family)
MYRKTFRQLEMAAHVTSGVCPTCLEDSMFVSLSPEIFRCVTCGADCRQYVNGKISYIPITTSDRIDVTVDV